MKKFLFRCLSLLLVSAPSFAADLSLFDVAASDQSRKYLGVIFGGSVGQIILSGDSINPILGRMFLQFNTLILFFSVIMVSYIGLLSTINTAHEGEVLGKKFSSIWIPLKAVSGMIFMIPSSGGGYSLIQMTVMWIVMQGIGAANAMWNIALDQLQSGVSISGTVNAIDIPDASASAFAQSATCMTYLNNVPGRDLPPTSIYSQNNTARIKPYMISSNNDGVQDTLQIGIQDSSLYQKICGSYSLASNGNIIAENKPLVLQGVMQAINTYTNFSKSMINYQNALQSNLTNGTTTPLPPKPQSGYNSLSKAAYNTAISAILSETNSPSSNTNTALASARGAGWIHAGSFYMLLNQSNQKTNSTLNPPIMEGDPLYTASDSNLSYRIIDTKDQKAIYATVMSAAVEYSKPSSNVASTFTMPKISTGGSLNLLNVFIKAVAYGSIKGFNGLVRGGTAAANWTANAGVDVANFGANYGVNQANRATLGQTSISAPSINSPQSLNGPQYNASVGSNTSNNIGAAAGAISGLDLSATGITNDGMTADGSNDPLLGIANFGAKLMVNAENAWFAMIVTSFVVGLVANICSAQNPVGFALNTVFAPIVFIAAGIAMGMWTVGASMAVYMPMIPYFVFTAGAIAWFIAVIEAIIAAPILALALIHPSGDEMGKSGHGITIIVNIFLRPTLMIFGFIFAARLLRATVMMVNYAFAATMDGTLKVDLHDSIVGWLIPIVVYSAVVTTLTNKCFSLIYHVPDKIMRWLGSGPEDSGAAESVGQIKQQSESGMAAVGKSKTAMEDGVSKGVEGFAKGREKKKDSGGDAAGDSAGDSKGDTKGSSPKGDGGGGGGAVKLAAQTTPEGQAASQVTK